MTPTIALPLVIGLLAVVAWPRAVVRRRLSADSGAAPVRVRTLVDRLTTTALTRPRKLYALAAVLFAVVGGVLDGPVLAFVAAAYGTLGLRFWVRTLVSRADAAARATALDGLAGLAADLRAGLPATALCPTVAFAPAAISRRAIYAERRLAELTGAVLQLADATGAPAADLVERLESDARTADRGRAVAGAEAAGAQMTIALLLLLPLGGLGLGYTLGTDPVRTLLHTPIGAAAAIGAVILQVAGVAWSERLMNGPIR